MWQRQVDLSLNLSLKYQQSDDTCVSDDEDDAGGDVIGAKDGDPVVVRVSDGELPLCHVQQRDGSDHLQQTRSGFKTSSMLR